MPSAFVSKVADKIGASIDTLEAMWDKAKARAKESKSESDPQFFGLVTTIFKNAVKGKFGVDLSESHGILTFKDFLFFERFILEKERKLKKDKGGKPEDDSILKVKDSDLEPILKKGIHNSPEFRGVHLEPVPGDVK